MLDKLIQNDQYGSLKRYFCTLYFCLRQLYETLIKNRLQWWRGEYDLLPKSQAGLRDGKSCLDNPTNLTLEIKDAYSNKKTNTCCFLRHSMSRKLW